MFTYVLLILTLGLFAASLSTYALINSVELYRVSQKERSIFLEVIVSAILSKKKLYIYMCPIPNGFRDRDISLYTVQTSNTPCPHTN
jgi:hypothetical protein